MTCTDRAAEIRPGDVFELKAEIISLLPQQPDVVRVRIGTYERALTIETLLAGRRVARPLVIGDRVKDKSLHNVTGELVGIRGRYAFVDWEYPPGNGGIPGAKVFLDHIERAPAPDTKEGTA